jgi:glycosyltransferase involved in cell wall biosynthesis
MRVAFCGPIAARDEAAKGGMESGAREMISELEMRQIQVCEFAYPAPNRHRHSVIKGLHYMLGLPVLFARILVSSRKYDVLHLTILYRHFIYPEFVLVLGARALRLPVLLNLRPGDWWLQYQQRSFLYRFIFRTIVRVSQRVAVESFNLMEPMRSLGTEPIYIPSFVTVEPRKRTEGESQSTLVKLVYLGALNDAKGLTIVLEARRHLEKSGINAVLKVIGAGDPAYEQMIRDTYYEPEVTWLGEIPHRRVRQAISDSHFFLFPTAFIGEGHSNALNECMAEGIVPIVSDHGANRNVVDNAGIVLEMGASASEYSASIKSVWNSGEWWSRSLRCTSIMAERFYAPAVMSHLLKAYQEIALEK